MRLEKNAGPVVARKRALELAQGRFLAFLDVDDFWLPHKLQTQVDFMLRKNCVMSFSDYRFVSEDGVRIGRRLQGFNQIGWHLHHMTRYLGCLTIVVDREKYPDFLMPDIDSKILAEDFAAWSQYIIRFGPVLRCPCDLARYTVVQGSRSADRKGFLTVWYLYRHLERIPLLLAVFYFIAYAVGVSWKRYWYRPFMKRSLVDLDCEWSLLRSVESKRSV